VQFAYHNRWPTTSLPLLLGGSCEWPKHKTQDPKAKTSAHMHVSRAVQLLHLLCYFVSNSLINKFNKTQWQQIQCGRYFRWKFGSGKSHVSAIKRNENKKWRQFETGSMQYNNCRGSIRIASINRWFRKQWKCGWGKNRAEFPWVLRYTIPLHGTLRYRVFGCNRDHLTS